MPPPDWKQQHANASEEAARHELVEHVLSQFADNMGFRREGLPEYGLMEIVSAVAQVVRARTLGFDPDLLRLTAEEGNAYVLAMARIAVASGKEFFARLPMPVQVGDEIDSKPGWAIQGRFRVRTVHVADDLRDAKCTMVKVDA